jgi:nucleotide-binding universal stress UspA family protein
MLESAVQRAKSDVQVLVVQTSVTHGDPGPVLCALAAGAPPALVLGSRGHGSVLGGLLGSASAYCGRHARCPVVVVPPAAAITAKYTVGGKHGA